MAQEQQAETERTPTEPAPSVEHSNSPCPPRSSPGSWRHLGRQERRRHCGTTRVVGFADAELTFHPLPFLSNDDVADVLEIARARIVALLRRKGVIADDDASGASIVTSGSALADKEPALAEQ
ncbi:MAG: hypothetical protein IPI67_37975 [Myxococcales bacterium]|nr:hypothetical protein [Myxococcales bacterium]